MGITLIDWCDHRIPVRYVRQEEKYGCAIACMAMVLHKTYQEVKDALPVDRGYGEKNGMTHEDYASFLFTVGYVSHTAYACIPYTQHIRKPDDWYLPIAPIHIVTTITENGPHAVIWRQGIIYDPNKEGKFKIKDYNVQSITGIFPNIRRGYEFTTDNQQK